MVVCNLCGTSLAATAHGEPASDADEVAQPAAGLPLTWVTSVENGKQQYYCDSCAREHLRSIEGKLDSAWW